jgi:WD40 repeat protein
VSLIWHPVEDGILCVWTADGRGSIWNVKSGDRMSSVHIKGATPVAGAWEPSGGYIAVAAKEGHVHIWDAAAAGTTTSIVVAPHVPPRRPTSLQWNPKSNGRIRRLLVGWEDGGLLTVRRSSTGKWVVEPVPTPSLSKAKPSPVLAVEWDPLSGVYALVAHICGLLVLWDMDKLEPAGSPAERRVPSLVAARWLPWAPGNFVTFSSKSMLAKVWNVSQLDPVSSFRLSGGAGGISSAAVLTRSGKGGLLLAAMMDGTIVLYNTKTRQLEWSSLPGHTETIFGVAFSPSTPDVIATCSYDGSTKIWHTPTMDLKLTLANQGGIIYTVCWSSGDGHLIATGNSKGSVWFWDGTSGKVIRRLDLHTKPVYKICWEGPLLASVSADKLCIVFDSSGTVIRQYRQPCEMYGCDWCPFRPHILAAGGEDGTVRVYDTSKHSASPIMSLKGHTARVFSVIWSPLLHHRLASGSDDRSIRIWQITDEQLNSGNHIMVQKDSLVLSGHSSHVRPLVWSTEVPWLILSGSWDGTVRAWDIRGTGKCIAIMTQHIADVYGLAIHPQRPFVVVSASRDTTMRYSSLEGIVGSAKVRAVFHGSLMRSLGSVEDEMQEPCGTPGLLCGKASQLAAEDLDTFRSSCLLVDLYQRMFNFFGGPDGLDELWTMVRALTGAKCTSPSLIHSSGLDLETERITYRDDLIPKAEALARHLAGPGVFMHRDERMRKDERLERAASLHLFSGDLVGYCELSIKRGMFDHALSLAAGISREYWLELMERRLHQMMEDGEGAEDAVPLMLAAGKVDDAMDRLVQKSDLGPALTVGVAASRGAFHCAKLAKNEAGENKESPSPPTRRTSRPAHESSTEKVVEHISAGRASTFYHYSQPLLGASSLLSIGQIDAAIAMLTAGNEMEVAYAVAQSLRLPIHHTEPLVVELAMQAVSAHECGYTLFCLR